MKWLIVEDALRDRKGHWVEYVSTFVRELRALGDEVVVLCDHKAQGFVMEQTGARPVLPESIWHRMGDGAGALKRYLRVPGHALATFFAMRKFFKKFNHRGHREHRVGVDTQGEAQGNAQRTCAGSSESGSLSSKLADSPVSESPIRRANGPASSPVTSHSLQATTPEASLPATIYQLHATSSPPDWIFVPTVLVHHLLGWWMLLKTGSVPKESRVLLFFPNLPIRLDEEGWPHWSAGPTTRLIAWLFENLRGEVERGKVVLGVETHAMRRALEGLVRMSVVYLPHPVPVKPGQWEARGEGRESSDGAGFPAESQRRGDFLTTDDTDLHGWGTTNHTKLHERGDAGQRLAGQAGASESDSLASKLADSPVSESLTRSASGPASALCADVAGIGSAGGNQLADSKEVLEDQSQAGLQMDSQKLRSIRSANDSGACGEHSSSVPIREIRGQNSGSLGAGRSIASVAPATLTSEATFGRLPRATPCAGGLDAEASASPIVFGCYGAARWEKGSDIFQEAIKLILKNGVASKKWRAASLEDETQLVTRDPLPATAAGRPLRFAMQWVEDFRDENGNLISIDPWLREHPQVEAIGRYFEGDEYEQRLAATDVMVLPYRSPYRLRVSRVVIEAILKGMPVIATEGTTLFEQAEEHGVVVGCEEGNAESLAEAMMEVVERFEMLRLNARERASVAAGFFSVGFFRELLARNGQKLSTLDAGPSSVFSK